MDVQRTAMRTISRDFEFRPSASERAENDARSGATVHVAGVELIADLSGALFWEEERLLVVSDLHLEKGSSFATRGVLLPPYDTAATSSSSRSHRAASIRAP